MKKALLHQQKAGAKFLYDIAKYTAEELSIEFSVPVSITSKWIEDWKRIDEIDHSEIGAYLRYLLKQNEQKRKTGHDSSEQTYTQIAELAALYDNPNKPLSKRTAAGLNVFKNYLATTEPNEIPVEISTCFKIRKPKNTPTIVN